MIEKINKLATSNAEEVIALRHHFHTFPERSWEEVETSKKVVDVLKGLGCTILKTGFGGTESGVVAELKGGKPGGCVALRADMDALPLQVRTPSPTRRKLPA